MLAFGTCSCACTFGILVGGCYVIKCCVAYSFGEKTQPNSILILPVWSQSLVAIYGVINHNTVHLQGRKNSHYISETKLHLPETSFTQIEHVKTDLSEAKVHVKRVTQETFLDGSY